MPSLPIEILHILLPFANIFILHKTFSKATILMMGALLCRRGVTVCSALRAMGLHFEKRFSRYHRLLNRDRWNMLLGAKTLLLIMLRLFNLNDVVTFALDDTLERRRGCKIQAKGRFKDAILSSATGKIVVCPGLRWMPVMLLTSVSFIGRIVALPFLTMLVPSEKRQKELKQKYYSPQKRAIQMVCLLRCWLPTRKLRLVVDAGYASVELAKQCIRWRVSLVTRLRAGTRLFEFAPPRTGKKGRPATKGARQNLKAMIPLLKWTRHTVKSYGKKEEVKDIAEFVCLWAPSEGGNPITVRVIVARSLDGTLFTLLTTDLEMSAKEAVELYTARWTQEVTHREVRDHLGMETQRQWSDLAIARTTPLIFALYSLTFIIVSQLNISLSLKAAKTAWYNKSDLTFSDLLNGIRGILREHLFSRLWASDPILQKIPVNKELLESLVRWAEAA